MGKLPVERVGKKERFSTEKNRARTFQKASNGFKKIGRKKFWGKIRLFP
jgi:hypothetical protein